MQEALRFRSLSLAALRLSTLGGGLAAQTAFSDSFDYKAVGGDLLGEDGGSGFSGPWFASGFNCQPEPASGVVKSGLGVGNVLALVIYSGGAFSLDELRLGSSFEVIVQAGADCP